MAHSRHLAGICLSFTLAAGCQPPQPQAKQGQAKPAQPTKPSTPEQVDSSPTPPPAAAPGSGRAYVNVARAGVFEIDERGFRLGFTSRAPVRDIAEIDGRLVALSSAGVQRVGEGLGSEPIASLDSDSYRQLGEPEAFVGAGARVWVVGRDALGRFDGSWTITPLTKLAADASPGPKDIGLDASGRVWLLAGELLRGDGERFEAVALDSGFGSATALATSRDRRTVLVHGGCGLDETRSHKRCAVHRFVGDEHTRFEIDATGCADPNLLALSDSGTHAALAGACGIVRLNLAEPGGAPRLLDGSMPHSLAIDDGGRIWAGEGHSLVIVDAEDRVERLPLARLTEISGDVEHVLVTGSGPTPPKLGDEQRGGLRGTLVRPAGDKAKAQVPVANAKLELCSRPRPPSPEERDPVTGQVELDGTRSACAGAEVAATLTTDAEGRFDAADLPIGGYTIAVELDGRWGQGVEKPMTMRAGMTGNIGKVVVIGLE